MSHGLSRRDALRAGALLATLPTFAATTGIAAAVPAAAGAVAAAGAPDRAWGVTPFDLDQVVLGDGIFSRKRDLMLQYLESVPVDRILVIFRRPAGLPENGVQPLGGWETWTQLLRGHYAGHLLSAFAQAYASTGSATLKAKIDQVVDGLAACRAAMAAGPNPPSHPGYLAAYPEQQFIDLETLTLPMDSVWAPYYTCHKIIKGLLDSSVLAGNTLALTLADDLSAWVHSRLSKLTKAKRDYMWSLYSKGEFGALPEVLVDLAVATGNDLHLGTAGLFDIDRLITNGVAGTDVLAGLHSNQHIPVFTGYLRMYDEGADEKYWTTAHTAWDWIVPPRMYAIGGTSNNEHWGPRDQIAGALRVNAAETCCAHNMLKLSRLLFFHDQDPKYMEYYERTLFNQILGSRADSAGTDSPRVTYYIGMDPGHRRAFGNTGTCCGGTGVESATKYQDSIWFRSADEETLYLNLFIASTLDWRAKGVTVRQQTSFPETDTTTLTIEGSARFTLRIRVPAWVGSGHRILINGAPWAGTATPGTYLALDRDWTDGDTVVVTMPMTLRVEPTPDQPAVQSLRYGPVVLVTQHSSTQMVTMSLNAGRRLDGSYGRALSPTAAPLHFTKDGRPVVPFHVGTTEPTHVYFRRVETTVAFGGLNTGVANRQLGQRTFLDEVWAAAPFADRAALVARIGAVADDFVAAGLYQRADRQRFMLTAARGQY